MITILRRKLNSARYRFDRAIEEWRESKKAVRKRSAFELWVESLEKERFDVLVGSNFAEYGGVRAHIHAIQRYSSLGVRLAPGDDLLKSVSPHDVKTSFRERFLEFSPNRLAAIHSHVFPWFIEWCREHRDDGARWVHTYHAPYLPEYARGELEPWQREINDALTNDARHAHVRISVSRWQQDYLKRNHDIETVYIPNGVDIQACDSADGSRFKNLIGRSEYVLYVGRNDPVKNPADFVRVARRLPAVEFVMIGRGLSKEELRDEWDVETPGNLTVLDELPHRTVLDAIAGSSAVVVTSRREGLPTLVLEALAMNKSVVVPDDAGCIEAIADGELGLVYEHQNVDDLADKASKAMIGPGSRRQYRDHVAANFDWRIVASKLDAIYKGAEPEEASYISA